jgi:hypothetical protein
VCSVSVRRLPWRRGENLAGLVGELLQAGFQLAATEFPVFSHHFPFHVGERGQRLQSFFHDWFVASLSTGEEPFRLPW